MALAIQYDIFKSQEECEREALEESIEKIRQSNDKVRRGTYASINEVKKECYDLKMRLEIMERHICQGEK